MKAVLLPLLLLLLGSGAGVGVGLMTQAPEPEDQASAVDGATAQDPAAPLPDDTGTDTAREYARLNNQFIIPVLEDGLVVALVVMSLNVEVTAGSQSVVFSAEPKLRDRFLQVMFDHANTGGFSRNFTTGTNMRVLRDDLLRAARDVGGDQITDVLIIDLVRQDT